MSYLITGGTGFIGSYISRLLVGEAENVVAYDSYPRQDILEYLLGKKKISLIRIVRGDITDLALLIRTVQEFNIKKIIHLAGLLRLACSENPILAERINCGGTANVLETARISHLEKVVYASSVAIFGPTEKYEQEYIPNDAPHYPSTIYGASMSFKEQLAEHYFNEYGVDSIGLRFPGAYGVGQREGLAATMTEELMIKPAMGRPGKVPNGDDILNWLYVEDAARAVVMASKSAKTKIRAFNIDGDICSVKDAAELVKKLVPGANITLLPGQAGYTAKYDTTKIREEIGYSPQWKLEEGIKQVIHKVRKLHNWKGDLGV